MNIYEKLMNIQNELKAPKSQYNSFGKYNYRNTEDILEGLKSLLLKHKATINITDEIVLIGDRYYVKATATLIDAGGETKDKVSATAYAREDETKKGMDLSQLTGSTSSYARKYALNGLFAIDDTKDSDATNTGSTGQYSKPKPQGQASQPKPQTTNQSQGALQCSDCSEEINQAVKEYSTKNFGKELCFNCQKKHRK